MSISSSAYVMDRMEVVNRLMTRVGSDVVHVSTEISGNNFNSSGALP
jgi:hypothetical protein